MLLASSFSLLSVFGGTNGCFLTTPMCRSEKIFYWEFCTWGHLEGNVVHLPCKIPQPLPKLRKNWSWLARSNLQPLIAPYTNSGSEPPEDFIHHPLIKLRTFVGQFFPCEFPFHFLWAVMCIVGRRGNDPKICEDLNTYWFPTKEKEINQVLDLLFEEVVQTYTIYVALLGPSEFPWLSSMIHHI